MGPTLTGAGTVAQRGEEGGQKELQHVVKQDPEPPRTQTDRAGPDMG